MNSTIMESIDITYSDSKPLLIFTYCHYLWGTLYFRIYYLIWIISFLIMLPGIIANTISIFLTGVSFITPADVWRYIAWILYFVICTTVLTFAVYQKGKRKWMNSKDSNICNSYISYHLVHDYITFYPDRLVIHYAGPDATNDYEFLYAAIPRITISKWSLQFYFVNSRSMGSHQRTLFIPKRYLSADEYLQITKWCHNCISP